MDGQPEPSHGPVKARRTTTEDAERIRETLNVLRGRPYQWTEADVDHVDIGAPRAQSLAEVIRRVATDDEARLVLAALDCLIEHGTPSQRQHAYDMLHRLGARQGSDGRWRPDPPDAPPLP